MRLQPTVNAAWIAALLALATSTAQAHKPTFSDGDLADRETAFQVEDPEVSIVIYRDVTCEMPQLWLELTAPADFELFVQLLVPQIERLADYRPSIAVLGPGLPDEPEGLPFSVPPGMGARVFESADAEPVDFDEPFTMTKDWILVEETVPLAMEGTHYVVAWDPEGWTGKLSVAVGTLEQFTPDELISNSALWTEQARTFHETPDYAPEEEPVDRDCHGGDGEADDADAGTEPEADGGGGGCSIAAAPTGSRRGQGSAWLAACAFAAALGRRARRPRRSRA